MPQKANLRQNVTPLRKLNEYMALDLRLSLTSCYKT